MNWRAEAGVDSPFCKGNHIKTWIDTKPYRFNSVMSDAANQPNGYVKVAYTFDFGRKTAYEENNVNRSTNSAIMKAE